MRCSDTYWRFIATLALSAGLAGAACRPPLVDESYATLGNKSINGIEAFVGLVEAQAGKVEKTAYMTRQLRETADVIIHFQRAEIGDESYFRQIEAMLSGMDYDKGKAGEKTNVFHGTSAPTSAQNEPSNEDGDEEESDEEDAEKEAKKADSLQYLTVLYFLRDSDASAPFWARLRSDLKASPPHMDYAENELDLRRIARSRYPSSGLIPLGKRAVTKPEGADREDLYWSTAAFPRGVRRFPFRSLMQAPVFYYENSSHSAITLLQTGRGEVLIRDIRLDKGRIILVCNAEPFLNFSVVFPENRALAADLITYSLALTKQDHRTVALVQNSLKEPRRAAREESTFLRFLKVFPLNVIVLQAGFLLVLYALSKWPHVGRPLSAPDVTSRDFIEHFIALGGRLARAGDKEDALRRLAAFFKKGKTSGRLPGSSRK